MRKQFIISLIVMLLITCAAASVGISILFHYQVKTIIENDINDTLQQATSTLKLLDIIQTTLEIDLNEQAQEILPEIAKEINYPQKSYTPKELKEIASRYGVDDIYIVNKNMKVVNTSYLPDMSLDLKDIGDDFANRLKKVYGAGKVFNQSSMMGIKSETLGKYAYYSPAGSDYIIEISFDINKYLLNRYSTACSLQIFFDFLKDMPESNSYLTSVDLLYVNRDQYWSYLHRGVSAELPESLRKKIFTKMKYREKSGYHIRLYYDVTQHPHAETLTKESNSIPRILVMEFDFNSIREMQSKTIFGVVLSTILACVIAAGIFIPLVFHEYFIRISKINESLNKLATGEFKDQLSQNRKDELGNIARNINKMAEEISNRENALKSNEENLSITLRSIGDAVIVADADGLVVRMNPIAEKLTGRTFTQAQGRHLNEVFHIVQAETRLQIENPVDKVLLTGQPQDMTNNTLLITPDGREYQISDSAAPIRTEAGELIGAVMVFRDVSEEYQRNKILQKQQALMAATFRLAPFGMAIMKAGIVVDANERFLNILGYDRDEIVGHPTQKPYPSYDDYVRVCEQHKRTAENITTIDEYLWQHKSGRTINVLISMAPLANYAEGEDIVTVLDITERKKMERHLVQSQKMEAVGQLAGGMAHDLNSFFSSISGYAEMLQVPDISEEEKNNYTQKILKTVDQAARLNSQLVSFSRKHKMLSSNLSVHELIDSTLEIIHDNIPKNLELNLRLNSRKDIISGDISLLKSAIVTLCLNARDAMPNGGKLTIETANVELSEAYCKASQFNLTPGEYIKLSVSDTGVGIPKEHLERIFEPFFSPREAAKGSGLGLAAVYGTVVSHKGAITVHSEIGRGCVFHIYIPLVSSAKAKLSKRKPDEKKQGSILVIDDEPLIRNMAKAQLDALGYKAITASNGHEGVELFTNNMGAISLVIIDMIMPVMDGYKTFKAIRALDPTAKIIITSGFSASPKTQQLIKGGNCEFLQKPMQLSRLANLIYKMMSN